MTLSAYSRHEADLCFALADPKRIDIIHTLEKHPYNVNELTLELGIPQPMTSRHLKILRERGLVQSTRHGVSVTYALSDPRILQALDLLNEISLTPTPLLAGDGLSPLPLWGRAESEG